MVKQCFLSVGECMIEFARTADSASWLRNFAGDTFNTAWYFHHMSGADWDTAYYTAVGDDLVSNEMCAFMEEAGIDTSRVSRIPGKSPGLYTIDLDNGERSFCYWRENSAAKQLASDPERLKTVFDSATEIYFSGITLAILSNADRQVLITALGDARENGKSVSFDPNIRPKLWADEAEMKEWTEQAASVSSRAFPTFPDEADLFGDADLEGAAARYESYGVDEIVVKDGADPCLVRHNGQSVSVPAVFVETLVDTTGAGDSFNGAYLAARSAGAPLEDACRAAHDLAAEVVSSFGALMAPEAIRSMR